jgi:hypothetical protein
MKAAGFHCTVGGNVLEVLAALWERLTKELAQSSPLDLLVKIIAAVMLAAFVYVGQKFVRRRRLMGKQSPLAGTPADQPGAQQRWCRGIVEPIVQRERKACIS